MSPRSRNTRNGQQRPRTHLPHVEDPVGGWTQQHSPYTVEGELEGFARFATGARRGVRRGPKLVAYFLILTVFLIPFFVGVVSFIWNLVR